MQEATRLLHNFSASALTLVDHTRNLRKRVQSKGLEKIFEKKTQTLISNPVVIFIKDLRQYFQHYALPFASATISGKKIEGTKNEFIIDQSLELSKENLLKWDNWSSKSKEFLAICEEKILIKDFVKEYMDKLEEFYNFFYSEIIKAHKNELDEMVEFKKEIIKLFPPSKK